MAASPGLTTAVLTSLVEDLRTQVTQVGLHTASPGTTGANEVTGGSYSRKAETYAAAANGTSDLASALAFTGMPAVTITHYSWWNGSTYLGGNPLATSRTLLAGDTYNLSSAPITVSAV
jgi:hypothetical protein